jgi:hypothetical protein
MRAFAYLRCRVYHDPDVLNAQTRLYTVLHSLLESHALIVTRQRHSRVRYRAPTQIMSMISMVDQYQWRAACH